jgi:hypothetical protein
MTRFGIWTDNWNYWMLVTTVHIKSSVCSLVAARQRLLTVQLHTTAYCLLWHLTSLAHWYIAAGPRQHSHSWFWVPHDCCPYLNVSCGRLQNPLTTFTAGPRYIASEKLTQKTQLPTAYIASEKLTQKTLLPTAYLLLCADSLLQKCVYCTPNYQWLPLLFSVFRLSAIVSQYQLSYVTKRLQLA